MVSHLPTCFYITKVYYFVTDYGKNSNLFNTTQRIQSFRPWARNTNYAKLSSRKRHIYLFIDNCLVTSTVKIVYIFYHVDYRQLILIHIQCEPMASTSFVCFPLMSQRSLCVSWARSHSTKKLFIYLLHQRDALSSSCTWSRLCLICKKQ